MSKTLQFLRRRTSARYTSRSIVVKYGIARSYNRDSRSNKCVERCTRHLCTFLFYVFSSWFVLWSTLERLFFFLFERVSIATNPRGWKSALSWTCPAKLLKNFFSGIYFALEDPFVRRYLGLFLLSSFFSLNYFMFSFKSVGYSMLSVGEKEE